MTNLKSSLPKLTKQELVPPVIKQVPLTIKRPQWSVMIPTYNCARFLRETIESVLSQDIDPSEMQIEVIDDCSNSDDPEAVVREFGQERVRFFRKSTNTGAIDNFNTCIERSIGHYVHILHGDDYIKPDFYRTANEHILANKNTSLYIFRCLIIEENGSLIDLTPRIKELENSSSDPSYMFLNCSVRTPGCIIKRSFYENFGGFLPALVHTADWEMWARATAFGQAQFINQPLAVYRLFDGNDTGRLARTGENIRDYYRLYQVMSHLYSSYPKIEFLKSISVGASAQEARFKEIGDKVAVNANSLVAKQIKDELPFDRKRYVKNTLKKWFFWQGHKSLSSTSYIVI
jgi:glycosyltransferase involved in cell wall biosynthesis